MIAGPTAGLPEQLLAAARFAGVTRLGSVTALDRLDLPVWQAIRPASRAVSVHSGKGFTVDPAKCGALGEAVESHAAEQWWQPEFTAEWQDISLATRSPAMSNWWHKLPAHAAALEWTIVEPLAGAPLAVPASSISNDFTRPRPSGLMASSAGQAAGVTREDASLAGLLELIERDAYRRWQEMDNASRTATLLSRSQLAGSRAGAIIADLVPRGFSISFHALPAAVDIPVVACTLRDLNSGPDAPRVSIGSAARLDPSSALDSALLEAAQIRGTWIAGSRDDLSDPRAADAASAAGVAMPLPPGISTSSWLPEPSISGDPLEWLVKQLVNAGFHRIAAVRLDTPELGLPVMKLFVPGLLPMLEA